MVAATQLVEAEVVVEAEPDEEVVTAELEVVADEPPVVDVPQGPPPLAAQAHTDDAPAITTGSDAAGQAVTTQGTRIWDRLDWASGWHWHA